MRDGFSSGLDRYTVGPGRLLVDVVESSMSGLLGRELDVTFGTSRAQMRPVTLRLDPAPLGIATGRLDRVEVRLDDVRWPAGRIDRLQLRARSVHITPGVTPALVAGPIDLTATLHQATLDDWLTSLGVDWGVRLAGDGWVEVTWPGRERWGHAVFSATARDRTLHLAPEEVVVRGRRVRRAVQRYAKPLTVTLPRLPGDARVIRVLPRRGLVEVRAIVDELREPVTIRQLDQMRRAAQGFAGGILVLPRIGS